MVLDTSAIVAVLTSDPGSERLLGRMSDADTLSVSAATVVEAGIVMQARYGDPGAVELDVFVHRAKVTVCSVTAGQAEIAREGFRRFGKGQHPAALNFGDCFSWSLARGSRSPAGRGTACSPRLESVASSSRGRAHPAEGRRDPDHFRQEGDPS